MSKWDKYGTVGNAPVVPANTTSISKNTAFDESQILGPPSGIDIQKLRQVLPFLGAILAAPTGGASIPVSMLAAGAGGAAGEALGGLIERKGQPPGSVPEALGEAGRTYGAGVEQAGYQGLGEIPGAASKQLSRLSKIFKDRKVAALFKGEKTAQDLSVRQAEEALPYKINIAIDEARKARDLRLQQAVESSPGRLKATEDLTKAYQTEVNKAHQELVKAASSTKQAIKGVGGQKVKIGDIIDDVVSQAQELGKRKGLSDKEVGKIANNVRLAIKGVMNEKSLGTFKPKSEYAVGTLQYIKQTFSDAISSSLAAVERGKKLPPGYSSAIYKSLRNTLRDRVPDIDELNKITSDAIRKFQKSKQAFAARPEPGIASAKETARIARLRASAPSDKLLTQKAINTLTKALESRKASLPSDEIIKAQIINRLENRIEGPLFGAHVGLGGPHVYVKPPKDLAGILAKIIGSKPITNLSKITPRTAAFIYKLMQQ